MAFRDAAELVVSHYRTQTPERVGTVVPNNTTTWPATGRPRLFVLVKRMGGAAVSRVLDAPIIMTQVWGSSSADLGDIADLSNRLRDAMYGANGAVAPVRRVEEVAGQYDDPDPASAAPRITFTSRLFIRARV